ncbi:hypothetical protein NVP1031O_127 [Vibrio phage 1.031.O._10N.261.46.F8]|nr:hypothetical protein NVP1031O_127 [Vibrio phage 1.031.O._10N.261.46.F8]
MITYTLGSGESSYEIDFLHIMEEVGYEFSDDQKKDLQNRLEMCITLLAGGDVTNEVRESLKTATVDVINAWLEDIPDLDIALWAGSLPNSIPLHYAVKFNEEGASDVTTIPNE